jgi:hypothetical protein
MVSCSAPPMRPGVHRCFLAFETDLWTNSSVAIEVQGDSHVMPLVLLLYLSLIILESIFLLLVNEKCSSERGSDHVQEMLPLNKWHMHGVQGEIGQELTVLEFLYHVILT